MIMICMNTFICILLLIKSEANSNFCSVLSLRSHISLLTEINTTTSSNKGLIFKIFYDIKIAFNTLIAAFVIHLVLVSGG